ncbi:hypothetical protein ACSI5N_25685 (plasmid) [Raoultella ornithinolytica]|uniref:hypothetical protein n=1 Tax=Raoultella ornithinolytica TaxID=54291 RepID=UPI00292B84C1|nr:hypothetical protein [Raoultella ornithinolytica]MDV1095019.1 hypothetical protein [Raoultella ornithinolytica]MDV1124015.1 hypothetical protein [Raoultella ornithinolytica]MDV1894291.1 hypothetical protein [Raoultella ornithinolytica]
MQKRILATQRFAVGGYTVTFAAGVKQGEAVVVFGLQTGLDAVPVFTLDKPWRSSDDAIRYVQNVTAIAAEKFLAHYQEHYQAMTEKVNHAFAREQTGFIAPEIIPGRYPMRGRK